MNYHPIAGNCNICFGCIPDREEFTWKTKTWIKCAYIDTRIVQLTKFFLNFKEESYREYCFFNAVISLDLCTERLSLTSCNMEKKGGDRMVVSNARHWLSSLDTYYGVLSIRLSLIRVKTYFDFPKWAF